MFGYMVGYVQRLNISSIVFLLSERVDMWLKPLTTSVQN